MSASASAAGSPMRPSPCRTAQPDAPGPRLPAARHPRHGAGRALPPLPLHRVQQPLRGLGPAGHGKHGLWQGADRADNSALRQAGGEAALFFASGSEPELVSRLESGGCSMPSSAPTAAKLRAAPPRGAGGAAADLAAALAAAAGRATAAGAAVRAACRSARITRCARLPGPEPVRGHGGRRRGARGPCSGRPTGNWGACATRRARRAAPAGRRCTGRRASPWRCRGRPGAGASACAPARPTRWTGRSAGSRPRDHERLFCRARRAGRGRPRDLVVEIDAPEAACARRSRQAGRPAT